MGVLDVQAQRMPSTVSVSPSLFKTPGCLFLQLKEQKDAASEEYSFDGATSRICIFKSLWAKESLVDNLELTSLNSSIC